MKINTLFLAIALTISHTTSINADSTTVATIEPTVESIADECFPLVNSPALLTLTVKDEKSLKKVQKKLTNNIAELDQLATRLQTLDVPSLDRRKAISTKLTERYNKLHKQFSVQLETHISEMPSDLKSIVWATVVDPRSTVSIPPSSKIVNVMVSIKLPKLSQIPPAVEFSP